MTAVLLLAAALIGAGTSARAQSDREAVFAAIGERAVTRFIAPAYQRLADEAEAMVEASATLCAAPGAAALETARQRFGALVIAWSDISLIRFGPVGEENRFERIWFFPDRRGVTLRQIQGLIGAGDPAAIAAEGFAAKSVAVQGLPALEFVLYGSGAEGLAETGADGAFRCRFAARIAANLAAITAALASGWADGGASAGVFLAPGPDNALYRSHAEVVRALLGAMTTQLEFVRDAQIAAVLGESAADARPKAAAFWRSGQALAALRANIAAVLGLYEAAGFDQALNDQFQWLSGSIRFEFGNILGAFDRIPEPFSEAVADSEDRAVLEFVTVTLRGALTALSTHYAQGAGITRGFNALDGD